MPEYLYKNPETGEILSVIQGMNDKHEFIDNNGLKWNRVLTAPTMSIDSQSIDPFSEKQFIEKTSNMRGTYGDMIDYSKEMSRMREEKLGREDPLKRKTFDKYKKERGIAHPNDRPKSKSIETSTYKVEY